MQTKELDYTLPQELIAQRPADKRSDSRLLVMDRRRSTVEDHAFAELAEFVNAGDCLVFNDTRVIPARFYARKATGGRLEGLFLEADTAGRWVVMLKNSRRIKPTERLILCDRDGVDDVDAEPVKPLGEGRWLLSVTGSEKALTTLDRIGFAPLPPYIKRAGTAQSEIDLLRYQTIYARRPGAVAAPTAGLHFTEPVLDALRSKGVRTAYLTLHVGLGTFKPVKSERLEDHRIHSERYELKAADADIVNKTITEGGRIIAVGTTSVRTLETVADGRSVRAASGETALFIQPGHRFRVVDGMVTNFHLPRSTLLALVGAFAGLDRVLAAYRHAIEKRYRFYSYGDAMLIL